MTYRNTRPTSPKGRVFTAAETEGPKEAYAVGHELGLPDSKVKRWLLQWGLPNPTVAASSSARIRVRVRKQDEWTPEVGDRVSYKSDPDEELGTVKQAGSEQSLVRWDAGYEQAESNTGLRKHRTKQNG